jgi:hypothetical protein
MKKVIITGVTGQDGSFMDGRQRCKSQLRKRKVGF